MGTSFGKSASVLEPVGCETVVSDCAGALLPSASLGFCSDRPVTSRS